MAAALTRGAAVALAVAAAALGAAGCGGDGRADAPIDVQLWADAEERPLYEDLARRFERRTGERVRIVAVPDRKAHLQRLATSFAARRPPDVFVLNHRNLGGFLRPGAIDPAGPRLGDAAAGLVPIAREAFTVGGTLQCVPQNASSLVAYVNLDRFARAGVRPPGPEGWTYGRFLAAARRLQRTAGEDAHAVGLEPSVIRFAPFVWSAGGEVTDDEADPTRFTFDTAAGRRALTALTSLQTEGLTPTRAEAEGQPLDERFLAGRLGILFSSRREVPAFRQIEDFAWDVAPVPVLERPATVLHSDGFCLAQGPKADRAWRFVRFATGPEGAGVLARGGRTVPSLRSALRSPAFLDPARPPRSSRVFVEQLRTMRRLPTTRNFTAVQDAADLALEELFYGEATADQALERIVRETKGRFGAGQSR